MFSTTIAQSKPLLSSRILTCLILVLCPISVFSGPENGCNCNSVTMPAGKPKPPQFYYHFCGQELNLLNGNEACDPNGRFMCYERPLGLGTGSSQYGTCADYAKQKCIRNPEDQYGVLCRPFEQEDHPDFNCRCPKNLLKGLRFQDSSAFFDRKGRRMEVELCGYELNRMNGNKACPDHQIRICSDKTLEQTSESGEQCPTRCVKEIKTRRKNGRICSSK